MATGNPAVCPLAPFTQYGITTDGYANLYEPGRDRVSNQMTFHRFTQCELSDPHYYEGFDCCATQAAAKAEALNAGRTLAQVGPPIPLPESCSLPGKLKIKLTYDPEQPCVGPDPVPGKCEIFSPDAFGAIVGSVLFGQAPQLTAYWDSDIAGEDYEELVKWEIVSENPRGADPAGLYPEKVTTIFTESDPSFSRPSIRFQTVHQGTLKIRATSLDESHLGEDHKRASVEVTLEILQPAKLGHSNTDYDNKIIFYANKYGIPPQYIKSQVLHESGFDAQAYRYELRTVDKVLLAPKNDAYWADPKWDLGFYKLPSASLLPQEVAPRGLYQIITDYNNAAAPPVWPYSCQGLGQLSPAVPVKIFDIFEADDGWPRATYPWMAYNPQNQRPDGSWSFIEDYRTQVGPCKQRVGWYDITRPFNDENPNGLTTTITYLRHTNTFYCGRTGERACAATETESQWLRNNSTKHHAQTVVASSYGIMQLLYTTAVQTMEWKKGRNRGHERSPTLLFDPDISLELGVGYDAKMMICTLGDSSKGFEQYEDFRTGLKYGFGAYNRSCQKPKLEYGQRIIDDANRYAPSGEVMP